MSSVCLSEPLKFIKGRKALESRSTGAAAVCSCASTTVLPKIKAILQKCGHSTIVMCRCFHWTEFRTSRRGFQSSLVWLGRKCSPAGTTGGILLEPCWKPAGPHWWNPTGILLRPCKWNPTSETPLMEPHWNHTRIPPGTPLDWTGLWPSPDLIPE